ncbi:unnamed protein product [Calypogeia fissa]
MKAIYPLVQSIGVDTRGISIAYADHSFVLTNQQLCELFDVPLSAGEEMSLEVPSESIDNSRLVTLCRIPDRDAPQLQSYTAGFGKMAYGKILNLGMRSLVKYGTTRILLKIGYDHMDLFRGSVFARIVDKLLHPVQVFKAMLHPLVVGGRPRMRSMSAIIITWIVSQLMEMDSLIHRPKELKQLKTSKKLLVSLPRRTHIDAHLSIMRSGSLLSEFDQSESVQVDFVKKQRKGKEVMLVDVSHLVTPEERRVFLDGPVPQNGVTLGGSRISEVTSLAKVLLEELVIAPGDQVLARSDLTPLRSEHDKVMKQNEAFKAQLEDLRGRLQGTQLEM